MERAWKMEANVQRDESACDAEDGLLRHGGVAQSQDKSLAELEDPECSGKNDHPMEATAKSERHLSYSIHDAPYAARQLVVRPLLVAAEGRANVGPEQSPPSGMQRDCGYQ